MSFGGKSYISMNSCNFGVCSAKITAGDIKLAQKITIIIRKSVRKNSRPHMQRLLLGHQVKTPLQMNELNPTLEVVGPIKTKVVKTLLDISTNMYASTHISIYASMYVGMYMR